MIRTVVAGCFMLCALFLSGQSLPSVDVETANMQIEQFLQENRALEKQLELLRSSADRLEDDIETWVEWAAGIEKVEELLERQAGQLIDVLGQIGSRSIVERAKAALDRYERISMLLAEKRNELEVRMEEGKELVERNRATIEAYEERIEQNRRNIELLEAAIAKSQSSESLIETYLEGLDTVLEQADELLSRPDTEDPLPREDE